MYVDPTGETFTERMVGAGKGALSGAGNMAKSFARMMIKGPVRTTAEGVKNKGDEFIGGVKVIQDYASNDSKDLWPDIKEGVGTSINQSISDFNNMSEEEKGAAIGSAWFEACISAIAYKSIPAHRGSRVMSAGEVNAIKETGYLRGGNAGPTFWTNGKYTNASRARQRLSLDGNRDFRVDFKITNKPLIIGPRTVKPLNKMNGGGREFFSNSKVKVDIEKIIKLK